MGLNFRKSVKMGPVRVNLSKSGVGYSVGGKGVRVTKKAGGGTRTTVGIPGTGISYSSDSKKKVASTKKTKAQNKPQATANYRSSESSGSGCGSGCLVFSLIIGAVILGAVNWKWLLALIVVLVLAYIRTKASQNNVVSPSQECSEPQILPTPQTNAHIAVASTEVPEPPTIPQKSKFEILRDEKRREFEAELNSIPTVDIALSNPVPHQLLKNFPEYSFSNITKKTRLDSIFPLVFLDVETTGFAPSKCEILEVSAIKFESGMTPVSAFTTLCKPNRPIPEEASAVNHITDEMVANAPAFSQIAPALTDYLAGCHVAGHNLDFDLRFIFAHGAKLPEKVRFYDTLDLAHLTVPNSSIYNYKLDTLCQYYGIWRKTTHRSLSDCYATAKLFTSLVNDKTGRQLDANAEITSEKDAE